MNCALVLRPSIILPSLDGAGQCVLTLITGFDVEKYSGGLEHITEGKGYAELPGYTSGHGSKSYYDGHMSKICHKGQRTRDRQRSAKASERMKVFFKLFIPFPPAASSSRVDAFIMGLRSSRNDKQPPKVLYNAQQCPVPFAQIIEFANLEPRIVQVAVLDAEPRDAIGGTALPPRIHMSDSKSLQARLGWNSGSPVPRRVEKGRAIRAPMPPQNDGERLRCSDRNLRSPGRGDRFRERDERLTIGSGNRSAGEMMGHGLHSRFEHLPAPRWPGRVNKSLFNQSRNVRDTEAARSHGATRQRKRTPSS